MVISVTSACRIYKPVHWKCPIRPVVSWASIWSPTGIRSRVVLQVVRNMQLLWHCQTDTPIVVFPFDSTQFKVVYILTTLCCELALPGRKGKILSVIMSGPKSILSYMIHRMKRNSTWDCACVLVSAKGSFHLQVVQEALTTQGTLVITPPPLLL